MAGNRKLVIVGGGMAAGRLLGELAVSGHLGGTNGYSATLISDEAEKPYNRVLLPDLLAGTCTSRMLELHSEQWYADSSLRFLGSSRVTEIRPAAHCLLLAGGQRIDYDTLVIATGASVALPDVPGVELAGVMALRTIADANELRGQSLPGMKLTVVGGGLLGLEAARALSTLGARVTVVHRGDWLLNRQLDCIGGGIVADYFKDAGVDCLLGATVEKIEGRDQVSAVRLSSGLRLATDKVLFATGTRPNDSLAEDSGIDARHGIIVDDQLHTSAPDVFAIGECARVCGEAYAMVDPVYEQATVLARLLSGNAAAFQPPALSTRLKVAGLDVFSAGRIPPDPGPDDLVIRDPARSIYRRLHLKNQTLLGAVLIGDSSGSRAIHDCLSRGGETADPLNLAFGRTEAAA